MRLKKYQIHNDLKRYAVNLGSVKATRPLRALYNAAGAITVAFFRPPRQIKRTKYRIDGCNGGKFGLTIYEPKDVGDKAPCLIYFHGGGFITRDFGFLHHVLCMYAQQVPCKVVLVNYRLAPKYPFPAGIEDSYSAYSWVCANADTLGIDAGRLAVGGDSAGAALATVCTQLARDRGGLIPRFQMLIYPVTDMSLSSQSMSELVDCPGCNPGLLKQMWAYYLKNGDGGLPHYASPMHAKTLSGLPPAYIETEEFDSLKDEGAAYAVKLRSAGVNVVLNEVKGTFHAFDTVYKSSIAKEAVSARVAALKKFLFF